MRDQLQQRLQELQIEQKAARGRLNALDLERSQLTEQILRRAGALAEFEALLEPPIVATRVEEDGIG